MGMKKKRVPTKVQSTTKSRVPTREQAKLAWAVPLMDQDYEEMGLSVRKPKAGLHLPGGSK